MIRFGIIILFLFSLVSSRNPQLFTEAERAKVMAYWNQPGRYRIDAPSTPGTNWPWVVRLTPEASLWFWNYDRARGFGKTAPGIVPGAGDPKWSRWEAWVTAKLAYDRWNASVAASANASGIPIIGAPPPHPGPIPDDLLALAGNPPEFAAAVAPLNYTITFDTGDKISYTDHPDVPVRYAYYRFGQGVRHFGTPLRTISDSDLDAAFAAAGMSAFERKVARAVSVLEGGFESINTYDTGFLSVGFIQFATLEPGSGSLGTVLLRQKETRPESFARDFRRYGIDVSDSGAIAVVDPGTGAELLGNAAVRKIIDDKRLTAVFQLAGITSREFRAAQLRVMRERYYPAYDGITVTAEGKNFSGRVLDVVKSEAGIATLFDRKVNRGNVEPLSAVVAGVISKYGLNSLSEAAAYEREIVAALKYRHDFLADASLGQPPALPAPKVTEAEAPDAKTGSSASEPKAEKKEMPAQETAKPAAEPRPAPSPNLDTEAPASSNPEPVKTPADVDRARGPVPPANPGTP